jgi:hypothetical protein
MKYKNRITTGLGCVVILGAVVTVFMGKADWLSAGAAITIGTGFLFTKDHNQA